ncbi:putative pentatricopeptide repeat-containing protein At5g08490 [Populus trichocarpa]|uniref:putative pentatricopeptide repeat-containing protein At5g08490 n=1 Tax=Populus trichocarpa TaxID=3694 RepID=UPI0022799C92|nr:putative pentatricopeptide repeat-containing protein At5g08490 [Populus trichocarpa]
MVSLKNKQESASIMYSSLNSRSSCNFSNICKNTNHLKSLKALLIVNGLIQHKLLLRQFLESCFNLGSVDLALSTFNTIKKPSLLLQNLMIRSLSNNGLHENVLSVYKTCQVWNCLSDDFTFPFVIKACSVLGAFEIGKEIHCAVLRNGYERNVVIETALVDFYGKIGHLGTARSLIDRSPQPDLVSLNALISCYSFHGIDQPVFEVFKLIFAVGLKPNLSTLASVIPVCTRLGCLDTGKSLHGFAVKSGFLANEFLVPALISMYARDVCVSSAINMFEDVKRKNVAVWNAMISACTQKDMAFEAYEMFRQMLHADVLPNSITFVSVIPSCEVAGGILYGESFHAWVIKHGLENQVSVLTALVSMYAKLGEMHKAENLFDRISNRNLLLWNVMVSGYVRNCLWDTSLAAFCEMQLGGFSPDAVSIVSVLSACSYLEAVLFGKCAHAFSIRKGIDSSPNVSNALLAFYSDCRQLTSSFKLFHKMHTRNTVSWNTLISGCVHSGEMEKAVDLGHSMQKEGVALDLVTLISVLPVYCDRDYLGHGMTLHGHAIKKGFASDVSLVNALISTYCKCGDLDSGRFLFEVMSERCVVSWNALITGLRHLNLQNEALVLFSQMTEYQRPNSVTLLNVLPLCYSHLQGTKDIPVWNAIISVHIQTKYPEKAVCFFYDLLRMGLQPDNITVLSLVSACAQLNFLSLAHSVMAYVICKGFEKDSAVSNALIDMYARCGDIVTAKKLFEGLIEKDAVSWSVMINGYCLHGDGKAALEILSQMQLSGVIPNVIVFSTILSACSHAGLVEQAWMVLNSMVENGISARIEHYACLVDLLGRKGHLKEAYNVVKKLPGKPSVTLLESLLGACSVHGNVEIGEEISGLLFEMDPDNPVPYVILSNIYAAAGRWADANKLRSNIDRRRLRKAAGCSLLISEKSDNIVVMKET